MHGLGVRLLYVWLTRVHILETMANEPLFLDAVCEVLGHL